MKRIAVVTDTHAGGKSDNVILYNTQRKFWETVFWPAIDAEGGVTDIIHGGDLLDRRKFINFQSLAFAKETFFEPARQRGITIHWVIGNHDMPLKQSMSLTGFEAFKEYQNVIAYTTATEIELDGQKLLLMPWICDENMMDSFSKLTEFEGTAVVGHLEFGGFEMYRGVPNFHGISTEPFAHVPLVMTGHYHHKSSRGNVHYLGSPFEMTWSDYGDERGFHWWTPQTNKLELVKNPHNLFYRYIYDDEGQPASYIKETLDKIKKDDVSQKIIKVMVKSKTQALWFDTFMDAVLKLGAFDVQFIDDTNWSSNLDDDPILANGTSMDSLTMIGWYVDGLPWPNDDLKNSVKELLTDLYHEAGDVAKSGLTS